MFSRRARRILDPQIDVRLSRYGEPPTQPDVDAAAPGAPRIRPFLLWRRMTEDERQRLAWPGLFDDG